MATPRPRALILDYGGVLCLPQRSECVAAMARRLDVPIDFFARVYRAERQSYDAGETPASYWERVLLHLDRTPLFSPTLLTAMMEDDVESWLGQREDVWRTAAEFRARGGRLGFLSNNIPSLMARLRKDRRLDEVFDVVTASCELGIAKPDPEIYRRNLDALGVAPEDALFVDDHPPNLEAATALGIRTFHFDGGDAAARLRVAAEAFVGA